MKQNVFKLWQNMTDYDETQVYGGLNEAIDWGIFRDISESKIPITDYIPVHLKMKSNKILKMDIVAAPADTFLISEKFKNHFDADAFENTVLLPATINEVPYYVLVFLSRNDCLNIVASQLEDFKVDEKGDRIPVNYAFDQDKIQDNRFFNLPSEQGMGLYCDEIVGRKILASDLNLMAQPLIYEEEDLRKRVTYNNTFLGISFEESENWYLECKQLNKIKQGKELTDKDWEVKFKNTKYDFDLFYLYRKQLLISTNWLQKAEIYAYVTKNSAEQIFTERSAIKPFEFKHPDLQFECRMNEYEWEKTIVAHLKDDLNLYLLVINRDHYKDDAKYKEEAIEVVKSIRFKKF
jgi:hypothetical protein